MSSQSKSHPGRALVMLPAMIAVLWTFATLAAAQDRPAPKWELFGGYSLFLPGADMHGQLPGALFPLSSRLEANPRGVGVSATYDFNRWLGITLDTSSHWGSGETTTFMRFDDAGFYNLSLGPKVTLRHAHVAPFLEFLVGDHRLMPDAFHDVDKFGFMAGGGLDVNLSRHIALRLVRADFVYSNYQYGPAATTPATEIRGLRLQAGLNFMFGGGMPPAPVAAACSAEPVEVFAGEPVTGTATGSNFNPKRTIKYSWSGTGVRAGTNSSTQIDTTGLQPGAYQVNANLNDGSKNGTASCVARFNVKQPRGPVIACLADPGTVRPGGTATIRSNASSPDNRRLTYSYSASAGNVSGTDATATLNTGGAPPGTIRVTCNVSDDRNPALVASAATAVNVVAPPPPPPPPPPPTQPTALELRLALHSIYFQTDRPTRGAPTAGLLDSQQQILITLARDFKEYLGTRPEAHLILEGHADPRGTVDYNQALTQRRVDRTKNFLIGQGVPAANIEVKAFGKQQNLTDDEVKTAVQQNPDLNTADRQRLLNNMRAIILASNRRVDVVLNTTGQQSTRQYPFNARDYLTLISTQGVGTAPKKP
jgi:outer membrane protein OmpA-like peptidoglycan-associated protein